MCRETLGTEGIRLYLPRAPVEVDWMVDVLLRMCINPFNIPSGSSPLGKSVPMDMTAYKAISRARMDVQ